MTLLTSLIISSQYAIHALSERYVLPLDRAARVIIKAAIRAVSISIVLFIVDLALSFRCRSSASLISFISRILLLEKYVLEESILCARCSITSASIGNGSLCLRSIQSFM